MRCYPVIILELLKETMVILTHVGLRDWVESRDLKNNKQNSTHCTATIDDQILKNRVIKVYLNCYLASSILGYLKKYI